MKPLTIGSVTVPVPVIQGGMGVGVSLARLASAVARNGAIGVISCIGLGMLEKNKHAAFLESSLIGLRDEIGKARSATSGAIGVNVMVALSEYGRYVEEAVAAGVDIVFSGAGLPLDLPKFAAARPDVNLVPIVSSGRAAELICRKWQTRFGRLPDAFVLEGPLAGGHLGFTLEQITDPAFALETLLAETLEAVRPFEDRNGRPIPVIAAGGIFTGADIWRFEQLGASGCQMGTRFVVTEECEAAPAFKQAYLDCTQDDLMLIKSPVGLPGRAIRGAFLERVAAGERRPFHCPYRCLRTCNLRQAPYCIANALVEARDGNLTDGFVFAGANAYRTDRILPVAALLQTLQQEYEEARGTHTS